MPTGPKLPLELETIEEDGRVTVVLVANPEVSRRIDYTLELKGLSSSTHRSSSEVAAGQRTEISRMRMSVGEDWCARLSITEPDGSVHVITRGPCR
ncbi:MAG: curli-like amyloid fiber formation chaperone CsgH [Erythrobacter sp.]|nr:curli-like amyloid fiber formation chaperone CsgH [Erythrobacter sp.]